jgi:uncharacterized membrane protein YgcG
VIETVPVELTATAPGTYLDQRADETAEQYLGRTTNHKGRAMVAKADSHVAVVAKRKMPAGEADDVYLPPSTLGEMRRLDGLGRLYTEIVVRDGSQVLPIGYMLVKRKQAMGGGGGSGGGGGGGGAGGGSFAGAGDSGGWRRRR